MGVKNLWRLLLPVGHRLSIKTIAHQTLAIYASIWLDRGRWRRAMATVFDKSSRGQQQQSWRRELGRDGNDLDDGGGSGGGSGDRKAGVVVLYRALR